MKDQKFIAQLSLLYENWNQDSVQPKANYYNGLGENSSELSTINLMQLLNFAVECLTPEEIYCQVGCGKGDTLIGALLNHPEQMVYAIDQFSEFDQRLEKLIENLVKFGLEEQVFFCNQEVEEFFFQLREMRLPDKIGVYFYNGNHGYRSQLLGLLLVTPFLADQALIIINDSNWGTVQQATWDFIAAYPQCQLALDLSTTQDSDRGFGNGIQVLSWDIERINHHDWTNFCQIRNQSVVRAIYSLPCQQNKKALASLYQEAIELHQQGHLTGAEEKYQQFIRWDERNFDIWYNLGMLYYTTERYPEAINALCKALEIDAAKALVYYGIGMVLQKVDNHPEAIAAYERAIEIDPNYIDAYNNLGNILLWNGNYKQAEELYRQAIAINPNHIGSHINLGNALLMQGQPEEAIELYEQLQHREPSNPDILHNLAISRLRKQLKLPTLYSTEAEVNYYRQQFTQGLHNLIQQTALFTPENVNNALIGIGANTNFFLAYQGLNDRELQSYYGEFVERVVTASYPAFIQPRSLPPRTENDQIRIGYISVNMRQHVVANLSLGWLRYCDRQRFEIYAYYLDQKIDSVSEEFQLYSDIFHHIVYSSVEIVAQQIIADQLDILVFIDIGMYPKSTLLAALRLAPIQCTTWCHPVTSGLPNIDYFLSSDLMEPENGQDHYSETLIRLPNLGVSYSKPPIPPLTKSRSDFNLPEDNIIYLSCQSLYKYLPQYDYIFAEIAAQVSQSKFAFLAHDTESVTNLFRQRLQRAFETLGLNSEKYCIILPRMSTVDYLQLNLLSDIFLDTFSWSGGKTTLEAIACNLPVVTCPGEFMRGRHSYGILRMLGVTETIADTEAEYIKIAVKLGLNSDWRHDIIKRIKERHDYLYNDQECVKGLEAFYQQAVQSRRENF